MPLGVSQNMEQPPEVLVRSDVPAAAGAPSVEAHAADRGAVLGVCRRGERRPSGTHCSLEEEGNRQPHAVFSWKERRQNQTLTLPLFNFVVLGKLALNLRFCICKIGKQPLYVVVVRSKEVPVGRPAG